MEKQNVQIVWEQLCGPNGGLRFNMLSLSSLKLVYITLQIQVLPQKHCLFISKTSWLMLLRETIVEVFTFICINCRKDDGHTEAL
jgi:hypothetical protein